MKRNSQQMNDEKKEDFTKRLPDEPARQSIFDGILPERDAGNFATTSSLNYRLFNGGNAPGHRLPLLLLQSVVRGEQDKAASILASCPHLLIHRGDVTDYSGRTFKNITAFQSSLWSMDTYMCRMMLDAIPHGLAGVALRADLIRQYEELEALGVSYEQEGVTHTSQHFDFSPLIDALQYYHDLRRVGDLVNRDEKEHLWSRVLGKAQHDVPAHVAQEDCHPNRSFSPTPAFNDGLVRSLAHGFNGLWGAPLQWWPKEGVPNTVNGVHRVLGVNMGIFQYQDLAIGSPCINPSYATSNLLAMKALCAVRTADLQQTFEILMRGPDIALDSMCVIS